MATILLVEDTPANRALATKLLDAAGHEVLTADTAEDGIRLALDRQPDLVLMDLGLPDMSGWQALTEIRADERSARSARHRIHRTCDGRRPRAGARLAGSMAT